MAELDSTGNTVTKSFVWGPDISDARGNASGAGGLYAQITNVSGSASLSYAMSDNFGNIVAYINSSGVIQAAREYSPFGRVVSTYGASTSFPIGYSGQYTDFETNLLYYGNRYYNPAQGRFINRDPIEEQGGLNLYALCRNHGVNGWDALGLEGSSSDESNPPKRKPNEEEIEHPSPFHVSSEGVSKEEFSVFSNKYWAGISAYRANFVDGKPTTLLDYRGIVYISKYRYQPPASLFSRISRFLKRAIVKGLTSGHTQEEYQLREGYALYGFGVGAAVGPALSAIDHWNQGTEAYQEGEYVLMWLHSVAAIGDAATYGLVFTPLFAEGEAVSLHRPYLRNWVVDEIEANAPRAPDGRFIDPNTMLPTNEPVIGHKPGYEFWRLKEAAEAEGVSQKLFNETLNNPEFYQIEDRLSNASHAFELK